MSQGYLELLLMILFHCCRASGNKPMYQKLDYVNCTKKFLNPSKYKTKDVTTVYFTMSHVYAKEETSLLKLDSTTVKYIVDCLKEASSSRDSMYDGWHIREIMLAIDNLTVNQDNIDSFVQHSAVSGLLQALNIDSVYEQECALNAIWSLVTDRTKSIVASTDYLIEKLEHLKNCEHREIQQAAKRILAKVKISGQVLPGMAVGDKTCAYKTLCIRFKASLNLEAAYFDETFDICYCDTCHADRGDKTVYARGQPPKDYGLPVGWCRFGLRPHPRADALKAFDKWHRAYHGTRKESVDKILQVGELAPAGRKVLGGDEIKELPGHFNDEGFKPDGFNTKRIFLSPSIRYSGYDTYAQPSRFKDPVTNKTYNAKVAFMVLVNPKSYDIGEQTIGADQEIDPAFSNQELEWIVEQMGSTLLYGLLVKVDTSLFM